MSSSPPSPPSSRSPSPDPIPYFPQMSIQDNYPSIVATVSSDAPCGFFKLPAEVRLQIYSEICPEPTIKSFPGEFEAPPRNLKDKFWKNFIEKSAERLKKARNLVHTRAIPDEVDMRIERIQGLFDSCCFITEDVAEFLLEDIKKYRAILESYIEQCNREIKIAGQGVLSVQYHEIVGCWVIRHAELEEDVEALATKGRRIATIVKAKTGYKLLKQSGSE